MTNDVFLNGVPHSVQTSELTKNAINPRNTFIDNEKNGLEDISAEFTKHASDPAKTLETEHGSTHVEKVESNYPEIKDSFDTHDFLAVSKKHITNNFQTFSSDRASGSENFYESLHKVEERIQNLRSKHPSKNIQHLERENLHASLESLGQVQRFDDNMQTLDQKRFTENRQLITEKTVGDNFQKLPPTQSRRDTILYKEKKNIQENLQRIEALIVNREQAVLGDSVRTEEKSVFKSNEGQKQVKSTSNGQSVEDELTARVRKMKEEIGKVNKSLTDFEGDKQ